MPAKLANFAPMEIDLLLKYFPDLTPTQQAQFARLGPLYRDWNAKINVISRKDIDQLYLHHVLHACAIAKMVRFVPGAEVLDLGTGGGFPGIPLAILFPETRFWCVDGRQKKILVTTEVAQGAGLPNVKPLARRAEELKHHFDFVTCRAVASLDKLIRWSFPRLKKREQHAIPNGLLALKGGRVGEEIDALTEGHYTEGYAISDWFEEAFFEEKYLLYVQGEG